MKDKLMKFYENHKKLSIGMLVVFCLMVLGAITGPAEKNAPSPTQNTAIERSIPGDNSAANKADAANVTKATVPGVVIVDATTAANKEAAEKAAQASKKAAEQAVAQASKEAAEQAAAAQASKEAAEQAAVAQASREAAEQAAAAQASREAVEQEKVAQASREAAEQAAAAQASREAAEKEKAAQASREAAEKERAAQVSREAAEQAAAQASREAAEKEKVAQASREAAEQAKQAEITKSPKATTPKSITASVKGNHYIGETLGSGDFTVYITMSDGATQTNPAGWSASPLTLSNASNQITVSYGELSTVITVAALTKSTPTVSQKGGSGGSSGKMVWIPTNGGEKYHSKSTCSKMIDPILVTEEEAIERGFDACKKCKP